MKSLVRVAACGLAGLVLGACGIPTSHDARSVSDHRVPFHLLSPTIPSTTTTTQPRSSPRPRATTITSESVGAPLGGCEVRALLEGYERIRC